jgi:hypothetical protein
MEGMTRWLGAVCVCVSLGLGAGCETGELEGAEGARGALEDSVAPAPTVTAPAFEAARVLDQRADGARIVGRLEPFPPNADPERVLVISGQGIAPAIAAQLAGARVVDARFTGDAVVSIGPDHVLRLHTQAGVTELDTHAYGPMSVAGTQVAYARGEMPFFELARADVATGAVATITTNMAPAWSPAFTPDGAIVFVSGAGGSPRLYRVEGSGAPEALPQTARTPASPIAPRFEDGLLVFEDEQGTAWLDLEQGRVVRTSTTVAR